MKSILMSRKKIKLVGYIAFFAFSFAWVTCNSHLDFSPSVSGQITHHEESSPSHNESCIDHTQVFSRIQGDDHSTDFSYALITTNSLDFSLDGIWQDIAPLYISEIDSGQGLFLENKVLRL